MELSMAQAFSSENFRQHGHELINLLADQLQASQAVDLPITLSRQDPNDQLAFWRNDMAQVQLKDPGPLFKNILSRSINLYSRGALGHQVPPPAPEAVLGFLISNFLNNGSAVYEMGMTGNCLEKIVTEFMAEKFGLGKEASGFVTSGGTLGNLTALLSARASVSDVWEHGTDHQPDLAIMVSGESHYSVDRAARIMGLGTEGIVQVPVNDQYQLRTDLLEEYFTKAIANGKKVFCIVGCACSTSTGSYDDLEAMGAFAQKNKIWFHVDGAHGGAAIFSPQYRHLLNGTARADSIIIDFHKMMMVPALSTAVLYRRVHDSYKTFAQKAQYLWSDQQKEEWYNSGKRTFECTKNMSIIGVYTLLRLHGENLFRQNVEILYALAQQFAGLIDQHEQFELAHHSQSNIVCFRHLGEGLEDTNPAILKELISEGTYYIVSTSLKGRFFLRVSLMNPLVKLSDLESLLSRILQIAGASKLPASYI